MLPFKRKELDRVLRPKSYTPETLVDLFESIFSKEYASDVGVWEGYSLKEHTLMVLGQFEKYFFTKRLPAGVDRNFFRVVLALHDIGKPRAVSKGNTKRQHEYTKPIIKSVLKDLNYKDEDINTALALVSTDSIGEFIKHGTLDESTKGISEGARLAKMRVGEFFGLLTIFFKVDAGSYTENAGGLKSLDHLFVFNPEKGTIDFSPEVERKVKKLREEVNLKT
ncbi:MAG: hypothetical protein ACC618_02125 [Patescibacteria group bacterium]